MRVLVSILLSWTVWGQQAATLPTPSKIDQLTAEIKREPTAANYAARGSEYLRINQARLAADDFTQAIRLRLDNPDHWASRAKARIAEEKFSDAIDDLDQAIRLRPDLMPMYVERGFAYGQAGD